MSDEKRWVVKGQHDHPLVRTARAGRLCYWFRSDTGYQGWTGAASASSHFTKEEVRAIAKRIGGQVYRLVSRKEAVERARRKALEEAAAMVRAAYAASSHAHYGLPAPNLVAIADDIDRMAKEKR